MEDYVEKIYAHYREHGFPYFPTDSQFREKEYSKFLRYGGEILDGDIIRQTMHGLSLCWSYMPHSWGVRCNGLKTPLEVFNDDETFRKVIRKRIRLGDNMSDNGIRKMMKMFTGTQSVSNFRPTAAKKMYELYTNDGDTVLDMSSGFGGRLIGASALNIHYIGIEPSTDTYNGLVDMVDDFNIDAEIHKVGSEDFLPEEESIDFCFTSPPYFNTEQYSDEETQSYKKFSTQEEWMNGFMKKTLENCYHGLKKGKYMAINIANVKSYPLIEQNTVETAINTGFEYLEFYKMALSNSNMTKGKSAYKYEPIYIFRK